MSAYLIACAAFTAVYMACGYLSTRRIHDGR